MPIDISPRVAQTLRAEVVRDLAGLERIDREWSELFAATRNKNPFLSFEWMHQWWLHFQEGHSLFVIVVRDAYERVIGIGPFILNHSEAQVEFLAGKWVGSDHLELLALPGAELAVAEETATAVMKSQERWNAVTLTNCDENSPTVQILRSFLGRQGLLDATTNTGVCPFVRLATSFENYLATLNTLWRRNFRYAVRMLRREGDMRLTVSESREQVIAYYGTIVHLHRLRFEARGKRSEILADRVQRFHRSAIAALSAVGLARIYTLEMDGKTVAGCYGLIAGDGFMALQSGFHPAWTRQSVGGVLMGLAIEHSIGRGETIFDFLRGDERYKAHWTHDSKRAMTVRLFANSLAGRSRFTIEWLRRFWSQLRSAARHGIESSPVLRTLARRIHLLPS